MLYDSHLESKPTVQGVLRAGYGDFEQTHRLPSHVRFAAWSMLNCRTAELGGHAMYCAQGHFEKCTYNSCRHRVCPMCSGIHLAKWMEKQRSRVLNVGHRHVIFTLPHDLNELWLKNVNVMIDLLFRTARDALFELLADPKYLGAKPGITAALHTWAQNLCLHPHLHVIITEGGLTLDGRWAKPIKSIFLPGRVIRAKFRGKFCAVLRKKMGSGSIILPKATSQRSVCSLINGLGRIPWNVEVVRETYESPVAVLKYLARYVKGGPIKNSRLIYFDGETVVFRAKNRKRTAFTTIRLKVSDFIQRLLLHVPNTNKRLIRHFGLYAPGEKIDYSKARNLLGTLPVEHHETKPVAENEMAPGITQCPICGERLRTRALLRRRAPP